MIVYFTGTGNSRYLARLLKEKLNDELTDSNAFIKSDSVMTLSSRKPYVFICPTYAWRIPKVFERLIEKSTFDGCKEVYFILTCGDDNGNAKKYLEKLCDKKGFTLSGVEEICMPENYLAMFEVPGEEKSERIIKRAEEKLSSLAKFIENNEPFNDKKASFTDKRKSDIVNILFYPLFVSAKKFTVNSKCISCGKCQKLCPLNNIKMVDGRPRWGNNCTHCMACICACPTEAIEYGEKSKGKRRHYIE